MNHRLFFSVVVCSIGALPNGGVGEEDGLEPVGMNLCQIETVMALVMGVVLQL